MRLALPAGTAGSVGTRFYSNKELIEHLQNVQSGRYATDITSSIHTLSIFFEAVYTVRSPYQLGALVYASTAYT